MLTKIEHQKNKLVASEKTKTGFISLDLTYLTSQSEARGFPLGIPSQQANENQRLGNQESAYLLRMVRSHVKSL